MQDDPNHSEPNVELAGVPGGPAPLLPPELRDKLSLGLIAIGGVLVMVFVFRMLWRRPKATRERAAAPAPRRPGASNADERLEQLMADAEELTRRLAAILDDRAARLELLIEQAEAKAGELRSLAERPAPTAAPPPPPAPRPLATMAEESAAIDPFHRRVYELADQGLSPVDIARRIERPTGQVELILALRRA